MDDHIVKEETAIACHEQRKNGQYDVKKENGSKENVEQQLRESPRGVNASTLIDNRTDGYENEHEVSDKREPKEVDLTGAVTPPEYLLKEGVGGGVLIRDPSAILRKMCERVEGDIMDTDVYEYCRQLKEKGVGEGSESVTAAIIGSHNSFDNLLASLEAKEKKKESEITEKKKCAASLVRKGRSGGGLIDQLSVDGFLIKDKLLKQNGQNDEAKDNYQQQKLVSPFSNCTDSDSENGAEREIKLLAALEALLFPGPGSTPNDNKRALAELKRAMGETNDHKDLQRMDKVLGEIYRVMTDFHDDEFLLERACVLIGKMAADVPAMQEMIAMTGALDQIMIAIQKYSESEALHDMAIYAMLAITQNDVGRKELVAARGAESVTKAMRRFQYVRSIVTNGALTLCNMCFGDEEARKRIGKVGGIEAVVEVMRVHELDADLQTRCCLALRNLTYGSNVNQWIAGFAGAMDKIVTCFKAFPMEKKLHLHGMMALSNLVSEESENRDKANFNDVIPVCINIMKKDLTNAGVVEHGLLLLRNLAIGNEENQFLIGDAGGIQLVIECFQKYRTHEKILVAGCSALRYMFFAKRNRETVYSCGHLEFMVRILRDGGEIVKVAENAILAIGNATFDQYESKKCIGRYGGISAVVDAMFDNLDAEDLQAYGCRTLRNLADCDELNIRLLGESGAIDAAIYAIMGYEDNVEIQEQGFAMLFNVAFSDHNVKLMKDLEVVRIVEHSISYHAQSPRVHLQASALLQRLQNLEESNSETSGGKGSNWPTKRKSSPFEKKAGKRNSKGGLGKTKQSKKIKGKK